MTAAARSSADQATTKPRKAWEPRLVHAYRREPYLDADGKEKPVEVVAQGESVKFMSNDKGDIVALVTTKVLFEHLTEQISEAYIPYGAEVPKRLTHREQDQIDAQEPTGKYMLVNGDETVILDDKDDDWIHNFLEANDIEGIHESLTGDTLRQAVVNRLNTA